MMSAPTAPGLEPAETKAYISHHTTLAGRSDTLFSDDAALIHQTARGLPRAVNNLAISALCARPGERLSYLRQAEPADPPTYLTWLIRPSLARAGARSPSWSTSPTRVIPPKTPRTPGYQSSLPYSDI
jgi:hypothetical protein